MQHRLTPSRASLHGQFSRDLPPALTISPGDVVCFSTLDIGWGHSPCDRAERRFPFEDCERDRGPALHGPVAVAGAQPGQTLEVEILSVLPGPWGWTTAGGPGFLQKTLNRALGVSDLAPVQLMWDLDNQRMVGRSQHVQEVKLKPFMGIIGMPEDRPGWQSGIHPRSTGGNMDCPYLVAGSRLYLPVAVPGGLISVGDGHALQGQGEVGGTGLECPMEVQLRFSLIDRVVRAPQVNTGAAWVTLGFGDSLEHAAVQAIDGMLELIGQERCQALALASLLVDLGVTQMVNGVVGVHAVLEHGLLRGY